MRSAFSHDGVNEHHNLGVLWNGIVTMGGEDNDLGLSQLRKKLKDRTLSLGIQTRYRLVQDNHRSILIDKSRQCQALPLATGEIGLSSKSCPDQGIDSVR